MATYTIDFSHVGNNIKNDLLQLTQEERNSISQLSLDNQIITLTAIEYDKDIAASLPDENVEDLSIELSDVVANNSLSTKYIYNNSIIGRLLLYQNTINANIQDKIELVESIQRQIFADYKIQAKNDIQTLEFNSINVHCAPFDEEMDRRFDKHSISTVNTTFNNVNSFVDISLRSLLATDLFNEYPLANKTNGTNQIIPNILNEIDLGLQTFLYASPGKLICISDVLSEIMLFVEQLNNLYLLEITHIPISVEVSSNFACNVTKPLSSYTVQEFGQDKPDAIINLTISPDVITPKNVTQSISFLGGKDNQINKFDTEEEKTIYVEENGSISTKTIRALITKYNVNFKNLIKLNTNQQEISELFNNAFTNNINGQFLFNIKTVKKIKFNIDYIKQLLQNFQLTNKEQISKKNILALLDAIFITWLKSINIMQVIISYCHHNCHTNNFWKATTHELLFGCMACNKLIVRSYTADELEPFNTTLSILVSTDVGNGFWNNNVDHTAGTTRTLTFTANIDDRGNYPFFNDFKYRSTSILRLSALFTDTTHYTFTKNFTMYSIDETAYSDTGDLQTNIESYALTTLNKKDPIEDDITATSIVKGGKNCLVGDFVMMTGISSNTYTYSFIDEGNTKRKVSINIYFGTILPSAAEFIPDNDYYNYDTAPSKIQEQKAEIQKLENFIREGLVARKHYTGIKTDVDSTIVNSGEVAIGELNNNDKTLYIAYNYDSYMIKAFVDGTGDKVYDEEMNEDYKMKQIKTWIREDTNDFTKEYGGQITEDSYKYKFSKILGISACQYPTGSDNPTDITAIAMPGSNKVLSGGNSYYIKVKASQIPVNVVLVDINSPPTGIPVRCYSNASTDSFKWGSIKDDIIAACNNHCSTNYNNTDLTATGKAYYINPDDHSAGIANAIEHYHVLYIYSSFTDAPTSNSTKINEDKHYHINIAEQSEGRALYKVFKADGTECNIEDYNSWPPIT